MADIQYDEQEYVRPASSAPISASYDRPSWLAGAVIKLGLAHDNNGAQKVLGIVVVVVVVLTLIVLWSGSGSVAEPPPPPTS